MKNKKTGVANVWMILVTSKKILERSRLVRTSVITHIALEELHLETKARRIVRI